MSVFESQKVRPLATSASHAPELIQRRVPAILRAAQSSEKRREDDDGLEPFAGDDGKRS